MLANHNNLKRKRRQDKQITVEEIEELDLGVKKALGDYNALDAYEKLKNDYANALKPLTDIKQYSFLIQCLCNIENEIGLCIFNVDNIQLLLYYIDLLIYNEKKDNKEEIEKIKTIIKEYINSYIPYDSELTYNYKNWELNIIVDNLINVRRKTITSTELDNLTFISKIKYKKLK